MLPWCRVHSFTSSMRQTGIIPRNGRKMLGMDGFGAALV
jgi:hypothetical protein